MRELYDILENKRKEEFKEYLNENLKVNDNEDEDKNNSNIEINNMIKDYEKLKKD